MPFMRAWIPLRFELAREPRAVRDARYNEGLLYLNLILLTTATAIALGVRPLLHVMSAPAFHPAAAIVPVVLVAFVVQVWADVVQLGIDVSERTRYSSYATWGAVAAILALYALLVPRFGGMGAAVATALAMLVRFSLCLFFSQRLWPVAYDWRPSLKLLVYGAAVVVVHESVHPAGPLADAAAAAALGAVFAAAVWWTVLDAAQRRGVLAVVHARVRSGSLAGARA
jgi:O-antigen/teichoic acid export membrane protein